MYRRLTRATPHLDAARFVALYAHFCIPLGALGAATFFVSAWARAAYDGPPLPWSDDDGGAGDDDGDAIAWRRRVVAQCAPAAFAPVLVLSPRT